VKIDIVRCTNTYPQYTAQTLDKGTERELDWQKREKCGMPMEASPSGVPFCPRCDDGNDRHTYLYGPQALTDYLDARAKWNPPT
jgi:hypothetical protein